MAPETESSHAESERTSISCPGCGRHDTVTWPAAQAAYHWKCFNCGKVFDLTRKRAH